MNQNKTCPAAFSAVPYYRTYGNPFNGV